MCNDIGAALITQRRHIGLAGTTHEEASHLIITAAPTRFLPTVACKSPRWRHATQYPRFYSHRGYSIVSGLMSYGLNFADAYQQVGIYNGRILKGKKPADLPVMQSIKFELVINLNTAKALGINMTPSLLATAKR